MAKYFTTLGLVLCLAVVLAASGCNKERIVESTDTEYIEKIEYIELPPDTVVMHDTIFTVGGTDTVRIIDTILKETTVYDTIRTTITVHDTVIRVNNVYIYDTVRVTDTVIKNQYVANAPHAVAAMQYHSDPLVFDFIAQEFGINGGWVYYLSGQQMEIAQQSATVFDIYAYVDYWTEDFMSYYPLEIYWRLTYKGGDPAVATNWQMTDPPASPRHRPGVTSTVRAATIIPVQR